MHWKFDNYYPLSLPARNFLSQCYFFNVFAYFASNSYTVRGSENRKWRWILRLTAVWNKNIKKTLPSRVSFEVVMVWLKLGEKEGGGGGGGRAAIGGH